MRKEMLFVQTLIFDGSCFSVMFSFFPLWDDECDNRSVLCCCLLSENGMLVTHTVGASCCIQTFVEDDSV